jgi:hypothetical protein
MEAAACRGCGAEVPPGVRFCTSCGLPVGVPPSGPDRTPWIIAGAALVALLGALLVMLARGSAAPAVTAELPGAAEGDAAAPPDISAMSPRERFDRLYNRVMGAAESGDEATVTRFTPMALAAYTQLDSADADARYHAALLEIHTGDVAGSAALADTILAREPGHLFGYVIQGTVARWRRDDAALARAYADFLAHYDAELAAARPEYAEHRPALEQFHRQALDAKPGAPGVAAPGT